MFPTDAPETTLLTTTGLIALCLWVVRVILFATLHTRRPAAHNLTDTVSDYANGPTKRLYFIMSVVTTLAWGFTAAAVLLGLPDWSPRWYAGICLIVAAVTPLAMIAAPIPPQGTPFGTRTVVHYALAIINFAAAYSPTDRFADLVSQNTAAGSTGLLTPIGGILQVMHIVMLVTLILFCASLVLPKLRRRVGLFERGYLWSVVVFYVLFTGALVLA